MAMADPRGGNQRVGWVSARRWGLDWSRQAVQGKEEAPERWGPGVQ
uniref:Uncharacterized protein n=1 Tax=Arundo donax TaxID=35708 RepID=A0A0A8YR95_ARUDO